MSGIFYFMIYLAYFFFISIILNKYLGKICVDELILVKKVAKIDKLKLPKFLENITEYKERLRYIGIVNGLISPRTRRSNNTNTQNNTTANSNTTNTSVATQNYGKNELIIKDVVNDSDIVLENLKTNSKSESNHGDTKHHTSNLSSNSIATNTSTSSSSMTNSSTNSVSTSHNNTQDTESFNESLEDYSIMYNLNQKCEKFDSDDIRNYINKEIAANTKNVPIGKPYSSGINNNSSFCVLL